MPIEIERKFLVKGNEWRQLAQAVKYRQGYISTDKDRTVRIRTIDSKAFITIKSKSLGSSRLEFEYEIPFTDAIELLNYLCQKPIINKNRYKIKYSNLTWEVDEFFDENEGLILAEVELQNEKQIIEIPDWIGIEVSNDPKYFNANLVSNPFCQWGKL